MSTVGEGGQDGGGRRPRLVFLDALRLLAAFQMIQGHTLDAVLADYLRAGPVYEAWTFSRGLTSTAFLAAAGMSFALATYGPRRQSGLSHRVRRATQLIVVGYLMHAPFGVVLGVPWAIALREASIVDVLQCIGTALLGLELLAALAQATWVRVGLAVGLSGATFALAGPANGLMPRGPLAPLMQFLTARGGSLFPLLPWAGFALAGYATGLVVAPQGVRTDPGTARRRLTASTAMVWLGAGALWLAPGGAGKLSPAFLCLKLALVFAVACGLAWALAGVPRLPKLLERLASETLFLYVSHVVVLYASVIGVAHWGQGASPVAAGLLALAFMLVCSACALAYRWANESLRRHWGGSRQAPG